MASHHLDPGCLVCPLHSPVSRLQQCHLGGQFPRPLRERVREYSISRTTGINQEDLRQVGADLRRFFNIRSGPLSVRSRVLGVERDIFNPREVLHMRDVKRLVWMVYGIATLSGVYLLLVTAVGVVARPRFPREVARLCIWVEG